MAEPTTVSKLPSIHKFIFAVEVGEAPGKTGEFFLFRDIASYYSGYFEDELKERPFEEENPHEEDVVHFPGDPGRFADMVQWLNTRNLPSRGTLTDNPNEMFEDLVGIYNMADEFEIPVLMNEALTAFHALAVNFKRPFNFDLLSTIYDNTEETSGLRRIVAATNAMAYGADLSQEQAFAQNAMTSDMLEDMTMAIAKYKDTITNIAKWDLRLGSLDVCAEFHTHPPGVKCEQPTLNYDYVLDQEGMIPEILSPFLIGKYNSAT